VVVVERQQGGERTSTYSRSKPTDVDANRSPLTAERVFSCLSGVGAVCVGSRLDDLWLGDCRERSV